MRMTRSELIDIIYYEFSSVYCDTCMFQKDENYDPDEYGYPCDDCRRNSMNWRISNDAAIDIVDKIIRVVNGRLDNLHYR